MFLASDLWRLFLAVSQFRSITSNCNYQGFPVFVGVFMERKDSEASTTSLTEPIVPRGASREQATSGLSSETAPISALEIASEMETTIKGLLAKLDKSDADLNHQFQVIESGLASLKAKVER